MRYQERIYIQNQNSSVRNRTFNNFNMSSDMCVFNTPIYNLSGATKIDCCPACPETITPHDTYTGGTVTLPTVTTGGDCVDILTIIRAAVSQAKNDYIASGVTAVTNHLNIEVIECTQVVKWRLGDGEAWLLRGPNGEIQTYYISDYTDTQNNIMKYVTNNTGTCCDGYLIDDQKVWNDFLIATGYTGTTLFIDLPYISSTSCKLNQYNCPQYNNITGATYLISANTQTIPLTFDFTANTQTFLDTESNFRYEIYKYNDEQTQFSSIPVYKSDIYSYSAFSATNTTTQFIPSSGITLDGDYLVKSYFQYSACTTFLKLLGKKVDTVNYKSGFQYGIYNKDIDYYFVAVKNAEIPNFINNGTNNSSASSLQQSVFLPESGVNIVPLPFGIVNNFVLTLNGLVLAEGYDYTVDFTTNIVTLSGVTEPEDIITYTYATVGGPSLVTDNIDINVPITSGTTGNQGTELVYYNTSTNKYEVYLSLQPASGTDVILMLNGVTLAKNIDYFQSSSNNKRLIVEGNLFIGDILTIVYLPQNGTVNGLNTNNPVVSWTINDLPQKNNGYFSLEVSTGNTFSNFYYSGSTPYDTNTTFYSDTFVATGTVGTQLFYRVKNVKNYVTLCGNIVTSMAYSDVIPITIQSNAINTY